MTRIVFGALIGGMLGLLMLPVCGAYYGATNGSLRLPPGGEAAAMEALHFTAYFWWFAIPVGALLGAFIGLLTWLVRWPATPERIGSP